MSLTHPPPYETPDEGPLLAGWLEGRDVPCPICAYNLRGVTAGCCPECGAPLRLAVDSPQMRFGPWLLAMISCALALGFDAVMSVVIAAMLVAFPPPPGPAPFQVLAILASGAVICGVLTGLVIAGRRRFLRQAVRMQWLVGLLAFVVVGSAHAAVGAWLWVRLV